MSEHSTGQKRLIGIGLFIAVLGVLISLYSTVHHMEVASKGASNAFCNINATFSCDDVARSPYSEFLGTPTAVWALGLYAGIIFVLLAAKIRKESVRDGIVGYAAFAIIGLIASLVMAGISAFVLQKFCLSCMGMYAVAIAQIGLLWAYRKDIPSAIRYEELLNGLAAGGFGIAITLVIFSFVKSSRPPSNFHQDLPQTASDQGHDHSNSQALAPNKVDLPVNKSAYSGLGEDYRKGSDSAKVTLVEFADFQCPACAYAAKILEEVHQAYGDRVLVVFKNYPLDPSCNSSMKNQLHEYACRAAVIARCAGRYGKFWNYFKIAYDRQQQLNNETARAWAQEVGLSAAQIDNCLSSPDILEKVKDDIAVGERAGVSGTPSIYLNGRTYMGNRTFGALKVEIDRLLSE